MTKSSVKYTLKTKVLGRRGLERPSLRDWKSRAHLSPFDNTKPKTMLGWAPEQNRDAFVRAAIAEAGLFGF